MKYFIKGICLGLSLIVVNKICGALGKDSIDSVISLISALSFFAVTTSFLISPRISDLLLCGFVGVFFMFAGEIFLPLHIFWTDIWFEVYVAGFWGSMAALVVSLILTSKKIKISRYLIKEGEDVENDLSVGSKVKLLAYAVISAIGFAYLVMPQNAGISVPLFAIVQFACLMILVPDRKRLVLFVPIMIMALNCFRSASDIWRVSNFIVSIVLFVCIFIKPEFKKDSFGYFGEVALRIVAPLAVLALPFKWMVELNSSKAPVIKRTIIAVLISVPCVAVLLIVLSNADMVFSIKTNEFLTSIVELVNFHTVFVIACGILAGLYLFGSVYCALIDRQSVRDKKCVTLKGDLLIINILLSVILFVYTLFVAVQFKYLFAGSELPAGLTYTEYARKGFFELLALTGVNLAVILAVVKLGKSCEGKWLILTKSLCHYLCAVTVVLLVSSFYRMMLYTADDGLTRLRLFVMGFLIFEALGLIVTFFYIAKPKFNITLVYVTVALVYYMVLNIVPADNIIAKNQIERYMNNKCDGIDYIFTLSADAVPAMEILLENEIDVQVRSEAMGFIKRVTSSDIPRRWQRYNLSVERARDLLHYK